MTWFKVDDKLHDHRKARKAGKAAMGVWVLSGSWSMDHETDGFIPEDVLLRWGNTADAARLVAAGLWYVDQLEGETGWRFHDWSVFQPSAAVTAAKRAAEHEGALLGNHKRWHVKRKVSDPTCTYCVRVPDREPDDVPDQDPDRGAVGGPESGANPSTGDSPPTRPVPVPVPEVAPNGATCRGDLAPAPELREDVELICTTLADAIEGNGSKRPTITAAWRTSARLMLDRDDRELTHVLGAIAWSQASDFWRPNIMSVPKLREKYDTLRLQAGRQGGTTGAQDRQGVLDRALARAEAYEAAQAGEGA